MRGSFSEALPSQHGFPQPGCWWGSAIGSHGNEDLAEEELDGMGMGMGVRMTAMRRCDYRGGTQGEQRSAASGLTSRLQSK